MKRSSLLSLTAALLAGTTTLGAFYPGIAADTTSLIAVAGAGNISDVDKRLAAIERRLNEAYNSGRLTQLQVQSFKKDLQRVADQEAVFSATESKLNLWETLRLQFDLDGIIKAMEASLSDRKSGFVDVNARRDEIQKRLSDAFAQGRLTKQEFDEVRSELEQINQAVNAAKDAAGHVTVSENIRLVIAYDRLSQRLTRTVHERQLSLKAIDSRQNEIDRRIAEGTTAGKISAAEATELKAQFALITDKKTQLRKLSRPLTADEQLSLAFDLEKLGGQVEAAVSEIESDGAGNNIAAKVSRREAEIDREIATGLKNGLMTLTEAQVYKQQLDQATAKEVSLRTQSGGELDALQGQNLMVELEKLSGSVDRSTFNRQAVWPGVQASFTELAKRIAAAKAADRLNSADEAALTNELSALTATAQGSSNAQAIMQIVAGINQLSTRVTRGVKDREISYIPDLDKRRGEIDKRIAAGIVTGKLTIEEANSAMAEYNRVMGQQEGFKAGDGIIDEREKLSLALELERLSTKVEKDIHDNSFAAKTLQVMKQDADQAIAQGTLSGKLTAQEIQALRGELNRIADFQAARVAAQGRLEAKDAIALALDLTKLLKDTENSAKNTQVALPDVAKRQAELYQRITEGVMQGRLTVKDSESLKKEFYRILDQEAKYRALGGLSFGEHAALSLELERLANTIESSMGDTQAAVPDVDGTQAELDKKMAAAVADGQLTMAQVQEFTRELDRISREEISYRFSGTGLSYAESISLVADLEKLNGRVDTALAGQTAKWSGIDGRVNDLGKRVGEAFLAQKIAPALASELKRELDRVNQAKTAFSASGGSLNLAETESLMRDLDRLTRQIDVRTGTGQIIAWTDIDSRQARVEARIAQDSAQGKLPASVANKAKRELQSFKVSKASLKSSTNGNLTYSQIVTMAQSLDKIDKMVGIEPTPAFRNQ